jgi:hypothetical protein
MSTVSVSIPAVGEYRPSLFSFTAEKGSLPVELSGRTSSLESDKVSYEGRPWVSWAPPAPKDSYLAFCIELLQLNYEDEDDQIDSRARDAALTIVETAFTKLPNKWNAPWITTDGGGGVRLTWASRGKEIRAVFPSSPQRAPYLYIEDGDGHQLIRNFTAATLCSQFEWLSSQK